MTIYRFITFLFISTIMAVLFVVQPQKIYAVEKSARSSAKLIQEVTQVEDVRVKKLRAYLEQYNSPMAEDAGTFVAEADKYNLDYRFLPAIAGVESWYGARIPANSYNGWGWGVYGGHVTYFGSWEEAIETISKEIRVKYMEKWGASDVYEIGHYYASDPTWAYKVTKNMRAIEAFEEIKTNKSLSIAL
jgi:hypothetical protein